MEVDHEAVLHHLESIRPDYEDFFIRLGDKDTSTQSKKEITSLTGVLYDHLPMVRVIVDTLEPYPFYVGYDGSRPATRNGTYSTNVLSLHESADEDVQDFIHAYSHELVHADQDFRNLLRDRDLPQGAEDLVPFLAHNLALEAAAFATEAITFHFLSQCPDLLDIDPTCAELFGNYIQSPGRDLVIYHIQESLPDKEGPLDFDDYADAWRRLFLSFFDPDSEHLNNYISAFSENFLHRMKQLAEREKENGHKEGENILQRAFEKNDRPWGNAADLKAITTMPYLGEMFGDDALTPVSHMIESAITQKRFDPLLATTRNMTKGLVGDTAHARDVLRALFSGNLTAG